MTKARKNPTIEKNSDHKQAMIATEYTCNLENSPRRSGLHLRRNVQGANGNIFQNHTHTHTHTHTHSDKKECEVNVCSIRCHGSLMPAAAPSQMYARRDFRHRSMPSSPMLVEPKRSMSLQWRTGSVRMYSLSVLTPCRSTTIM